MKEIKIIFFDIDGTLIDMEKKYMTQTTLKTLQQLKEQGILLCIATGRGPTSLPEFSGIDFDAFLTFNGSYCYGRRGDIFCNPIPAVDVKKLVANAASLGRPVAIATKDRVAANGSEPDLVDYYAIADQKLKIAPDFDELLEENVYQVMMGCREAEYPAILQGVSHAKIAAWWDRAADIIPATGGKGIGVEKILEYFGLDRSQAMAFGDGNNDIEMLQTVGTGVAMGNGSEKLKSVADAVCGSVSREGVREYCISQGLITE